MRFFKRSIFVLGILVLVLASAWTAFAFWARDKYVVPVLMYHMVGNQIVDDGDLNSVSPRAFARQMGYLKNNGYQVISLNDLAKGIRKGRMFNRHSVVITFDDGYEDNYTNAFPVLKKYNYPAIVFVISDVVGTPGFMTWEQLKEIDDAGFKVGSHTRRHAYLPDFKDDPSRLDDEIINSKKTFEKNLGRSIFYFSYPAGGFSEAVKEVVQKAGYKGACATNRGYDRFNRDVYELRRIRVNEEDSSLVLWAKLSGYYNLFRELKNPY